ncbi:hypothetical protein D3C75_1127650 [compost metagenome]
MAKAGRRLPMFRSMVMMRSAEARAIYKILSPSSVAIEQDSFNNWLMCFSTGWVAFASGVAPR